jgi:hypothetical protein
MPHRIITGSRYPVSPIPAAADDGLGITRRNVIVRRDDANIVSSAAHMKALGDLLLIKKAVVTTTHTG